MEDPKTGKVQKNDITLLGQNTTGEFSGWPTYLFIKIQNDT